MKEKRIKLFLRISIAVGFLSAVADRLGIWPAEISSWGNWESFITYTAYLNPWAPEMMVVALGIIATAAEVILAIMLLVGFKTRWAALLSGGLMLTFALAMTLAGGVKAPLDYSVFTASAAAWSLSCFKSRFLELDEFFEK